MTTIYLIRNTETGEERLVRAPRRAAAMKHVMKPLTITPATPEQLVALLTGREPITVEDADPAEPGDAANEPMAA